MKISFTTLSCPEWSWETIMNEAKRLGYDGIEIRGIEGEMNLPKVEQFTKENLDATLEALKERGLEISCLDTSCIFHDADKFDASIEEGKATIDLAKAMGVPYIRVFGDKIPNIDKKDETIAQVAKGLEELGKYAEDKGVFVLIETHGDFSNSDYLLEVLEKTTSSSIGVIWDIANPFGGNGELPVDTFKKLSKYIKHTHIKDIKGTGENVDICMVGEGDIPIEDVVVVLKENGYDGWLSFEWEKKWHPDIEEPEVALPHFVEYIKKFL